MKKAIILGGTEDHIRLIEILKSSGYYTLLIDFHENPPAKSVADFHIKESTLDMDKVMQIAEEHNPALVITACIDQALLTMAYVCQKLNLPCHISYQTALELTNKSYMKRIFNESDIPTSKFITLDRYYNDETISLDCPVVVKPVDSNSSKGITKVQHKEYIGEAIACAFSNSRSHKVIVEEFIEGEELSVDVVIIDSEPSIVMISRNIKSQLNQNNFTIVQSLYQPFKDEVVIDVIKQIAKKIAIAYHIKNGPLLIQLIHNRLGTYVIEFSSRIGGGSKHHFIQKMTGFDLLDWFVKMLLNDIYDIRFHYSYNWGSVNYLYGKTGIINRFIGFDVLQSEEVIEQFFYYKTVGMQVSNNISSADRLAGYMIVDNDYHSYEKKMHIAAESIRILNIDNEDMIIRKQISRKM